MVLFITFLISLLGICFLLVNAYKEQVTGRPLLSLVFVHDRDIKNHFFSWRAKTKDWPKHAFNTSMFYIVKYGLHYTQKLKAKIYPHISHIVDAVKGRHIPKNKGSVSLFLKKMEGYKDIEK